MSLDEFNTILLPTHRGVGQGEVGVGGEAQEVHQQLEEEGGSGKAPHGQQAQAQVLRVQLAERKTRQRVKRYPPNSCRKNMFATVSEKTFISLHLCRKNLFTKISIQPGMLAQKFIDIPFEQTEYRRKSCGVHYFNYVFI